MIKQCGKALPLCNMLMIGLLQGRGYICSMTTIMIMMANIRLLAMMMMIFFLSGTKAIKNVRPRKQKQKKS